MILIGNLIFDNVFGEFLSEIFDGGGDLGGDTVQKITSLLVGTVDACQIQDLFDRFTNLLVLQDVSDLLLVNAESLQFIC